MIKSDIQFYPTTQIEADIDFLKYQIKKRQVTLIANSGLQKLIDDCNSYLALAAGDPIYNTTLQPLLVMYSLSDTLRMLWMKRVDFEVQLRAMNTGDFAYGVTSVGNSINFKDFELEIFSAAYLNEYGVKATLPQHTNGNDLFYKDIEIQCKHPEVLTRQKIDGFLRDFQISLQDSQKYGVFGIGIDDYLQFNETTFPFDFDAYFQAYSQKLREIDVELKLIFDDTMRFCPRVLGVYLINTHFTYNDRMGISLTKTTNSTFCIRPNAREVPEEIHIQAYEVISVFNTKPSIRTY